MAPSPADLLSPQQLRLLDDWLGEWHVEEDMSWELQDIRVLRVGTPRGPAVVKASRTSHHIQREIRAHQRMTAPLGARSPRLLHGDGRAGLVVSTWLPGRLVQGGPYEHSPATFAQAGQLLALLHRPVQETRSYDSAAVHKIGDFLERARGLAPAAHLTAVRGIVDAHRPSARWLYATHGDYQPRNWVEDRGTVGVIDFGRAGYRPWVTDFVRLEHAYFTDHPELRTAFLTAYGRDPAEEMDSWRLDNILQALGTLVWAHDVGDAPFEESGRKMLTRVVERFA
ncbi:aminoglycoside phosphotransferase family protein [Sinomonas susongensis]|uniref:phosphotransferase n=1 Tax=Sinomonas susongensis TaxID=1324851 RepID=UPI0011083FC3|nr:aminoglycoside phosphotransferase family protein [Sinomonas susongensis]